MGITNHFPENSFRIIVIIVVKFFSITIFDELCGYFCIGGVVTNILRRDIIFQRHGSPKFNNRQLKNNPPKNLTYLFDPI